MTSLRWDMVKVVYASTPEQEETVHELVDVFYQEIFPRYFTDDEIVKFEEWKVLHLSTFQIEKFGTLKEAYQVITSLQTLILILNAYEVLPKYKALFDRNVQTLKQFGLFFPFEWEHFSSKRYIINEQLSAYVKPANEFLI